MSQQDPPTLLTLQDAAQRLPNRPHYTTLWRWCRRGIRGVRLEYLRYGRAIFIAPDALDRFGLALAQADPAVAPAKATARSSEPLPVRPRRNTGRDREKEQQDAQVFLSQWGM